MKLTWKNAQLIERSSRRMWLFSNEPGLAAISAKWRRSGAARKTLKWHFDEQRQRGGRFSLKRHLFMCRRPPNWPMVSFDLSTRPKWESAGGKINRCLPPPLHRMTSRDPHRPPIGFELIAFSLALDTHKKSSTDEKRRRSNCFPLPMCSHNFIFIGQIIDTLISFTFISVEYSINSI